MRTNNKKGISLIVLVITIIVMIILAAAIILSLNNSGIIGRSNEAKFKNDVSAMKEELDVLIASKALEGSNVEITIDNLSSAKSYKEKFAVQDDELRFVRAKLTEEEITIAKELDMKPYGTVLVNGQNGITISDAGVLTVNASEFNLVDIKIPEGVTEIKSAAFGNCDSLLSVIIPSSVTDFTAAFVENNSLAEVTFLEGVTEIDSYAFSKCDSLKKVNLPNSLTSISAEAFESCDSLDNISIPSSVVSFGSYCFGNCSALKSIVVNGSIGERAFSGCSSLTNVTLLEGVTYIGEYAFYGTSFTTITLPSTLTYIDHVAFPSTLTSITIPANVTTVALCAFSPCTLLNNITIEGTARFNAVDIKKWFTIDGTYDISDITITGSGYISE